MKANRANAYRGIIDRKVPSKRGNVLEYVYQGGISSLIMLASDVIGQLITGGNFSFVTPVAMFLYGFFTGVVCYTMYTNLDRGMGGKDEKNKDKLKKAVYKMAVDQLLWNPASTLVYVVYTSLIDTQSRTKKDLIQMYVEILFKSYRLWPLVQLVNFFYVPAKLQILFMGVVSLLWNIYIKIIRGKK